MRNAVPYKATGGSRSGSGNRGLREICGEEAGGGKGGAVVEQEPPNPHLATYLLSHQSAGPLQHLSPAAFLRLVNRSHFTDDRLMCLHKLRPLDTAGQRGGVWEADERMDVWRWKGGLGRKKSRNMRVDYEPQISTRNSR